MIRVYNPDFQAHDARAMNLNDYDRLLALARRRSRRADEAEDLLHEALVVAAQAGRTDPATENNTRWLAGVIRRLAALRARLAIRRRRIEGKMRVAGEYAAPGPPAGSAEVLDRMPRSARAVAVLVLHGLKREEIAHALGLTSTAIRQRIREVRKSLAGASPELRREALALAYHRQAASRDLELGLIRRSLLDALRIRGGLGTHDPDGHLLVFSAKGLTKSAPRAT